MRRRTNAANYSKTIQETISVLSDVSDFVRKSGNREQQDSIDSAIKHLNQALRANSRRTAQPGQLLRKQEEK